MSQAATAEAGAVQPAAARAGRPSPWREWVMMAVVVLTPIAAYLNNQSFAVLVAVGGLVTAPLLFRDRRPMLGLAFLLALAAWAAVSMNWSLFRQPSGGAGLSIEDMTGVKMFLEVGLYGAFVSMAAGMSRDGAGRVGLVLVGGLGLLALLFLAEALSGARLYYWLRTQVGQTPEEPAIAVRDVSRVAYVLALLFWPVAVRLEALKLWWVAAIMAAATVAGAALLGADAPAAALAVSAVVFFLVRWRGRAAIWACLAAAAVYLVAAPLLVNLAFPPVLEQAVGADPAKLSWSIRIDIWRFAAERILERPFFGWGLDASRIFSPHIQLHPHNGALQLWLELGAVGVALATLFWAWLFGRIDRIDAADRPMAAASAATATVYLVIGALSFGVWQEWWIALGALAAAACAMGIIARRRDAAAAAPQAASAGA